MMLNNSWLRLHLYVARQPQQIEIGAAATPKP
jgi:hypothetical protein